jgi:heme-degrading monooxygenase HmoA
MAEELSLSSKKLNSQSTPKPPYYAVIFTSTRPKTPVNPQTSSELNDSDYSDVAQHMLELAFQSPGYLGVDSVSRAVVSDSSEEEETQGITISYWISLESIKIWKMQTDHVVARKLGKTLWYSQYKVRICKVEREYSFERLDETETEKAVA